MIKKPKKFETIERHLEKRKFQPISSKKNITFARLLKQNLSMRVEVPYYLKDGWVYRTEGPVKIYFVTRNENNRIVRVGGAYCLSISQTPCNVVLRNLHDLISKRDEIMRTKDRPCNKCPGTGQYVLQNKRVVECNRCAGKGFQIASDIERNKRYDCAIMRQYEDNFEQAIKDKVDWHPYSTLSTGLYVSG